MRLLRIMLVISMLVANYAATAQAFGGMSHCPHGITAGAKLMDCCKHKSGKPMQCPCPSGECCFVSLQVALPTGFSVHSVSAAALPEILPARALSQILTPPEFRPPDFLA